MKICPVDFAAFKTACNSQNSVGHIQKSAIVNSSENGDKFQLSTSFKGSEDTIPEQKPIELGDIILDKDHGADNDPAVKELRGHDYKFIETASNNKVVRTDINFPFDKPQRGTDKKIFFPDGKIVPEVQIDALAPQGDLNIQAKIKQNTSKANTNRYKGQMTIGNIEMPGKTCFIQGIGIQAGDINAGSIRLIGTEIKSNILLAKSSVIVRAEEDDPTVKSSANLKSNCNNLNSFNKVKAGSIEGNFESKGILDSESFVLLNKGSDVNEVRAQECALLLGSKAKTVKSPTIILSGSTTENETTTKRMLVENRVENVIEKKTEDKTEDTEDKKEKKAAEKIEKKAKLDGKIKSIDGNPVEILVTGDPNEMIGNIEFDPDGPEGKVFIKEGQSLDPKKVKNGEIIPTKAESHYHDEKIKDEDTQEEKEIKVRDYIGMKDRIKELKEALRASSSSIVKEYFAQK